MRQGLRKERPRRAEKIRVLLADDHSVVLEGLSAIISRQRDISVVAEANDGEECLSAWRAHRPDVVLLDLRMPKLDGVEALRAIRREDPAARVIVLTTYDTDEDIYRAVKAGAKGYLLKDARRDDLLDCIRRVHAGETRISPDVAARLIGRLANAPLTERELEVLERVARGDSNKEIAATFDLTEGTVKSHLKSIFAKLEVESRTAAVAEGVQRGLIHF
jgi:DNA-binding NarL/FixJ family response regulator